MPAVVEVQTGSVGGAEARVAEGVARGGGCTGAVGGVVARVRV